MDFTPEPSRLPLESSEEEGTSDLQLRTYFKQTKHRHKRLFTNITLSNRLDFLYSDFTPGQARSESDGYFCSKSGMKSEAWRI